MQTNIVLYLSVYTSIIFFSFLLMPWGMYKLAPKGTQSFSDWLKCYKIAPMEIVFSIACLLTIMIFNALHMIVPLILSFYALIAFQHHTRDDKPAIPHNQKYLPAFFLVFGLYVLIMTGFTFFGVFEKANTINDYRLIQLPIILTITGCYLFKVRLRDFNWAINAKTFLYVFSLFAVLKLSFIVATDFDSLRSLPIDYYFRNFIQQLYYPGIVEEVIFRGFLFSGLLSLGIRESKANIIQAVVFGLIHALPPNELTLISILSTSMQMYLGYLIGKLYLSTKSLTPCIILHALIDTI